MTYLFLASFIAGLLLGVRLMFYGAERKRKPNPAALPLRRSEPAVVGFLVMFGVLGYLLTRSGAGSSVTALLVALPAGAIFAAVVTWLAIQTARVQPEHDPDDPRYVLQGRVGVVTVSIPEGGEGMIRYEEGAGTTVPARNIDGGAISEGEEVCIERVEDGIAHVELWRLVEQRL